MDVMRADGLISRGRIASQIGSFSRAHSRWRVVGRALGPAAPLSDGDGVLRSLNTVPCRRQEDRKKSRRDKRFWGR